jgi:hypothetical protein
MAEWACTPEPAHDIVTPDQCRDVIRRKPAATVITNARWNRSLDADAHLRRCRWTMLARVVCIIAAAVVGGWPRGPWAGWRGRCRRPTRVAPYSETMIKHIVIWTLADEALGQDKAANLAEAKRRLDTCAGLVDGIVSFSVGVPQEGLEAGGDLCLVSEFADADALRAYAGHPDHLAVGAFLNQVRTSRIAFDFDDAN